MMTPTLPPRRPLLAALASLVLPGFGQLYNGDLNRAIWLFLSFALLCIPGVALVALYEASELSMEQVAPIWRAGIRALLRP